MAEHPAQHTVPNRGQILDVNTEELVAPDPTGPSGLQRFARNLGRAGISLATGIPAIELDKRIAQNKLLEAQAGTEQQEAEAGRLEAEKQAELQRLTQIAFPVDGIQTRQADEALQRIFAIDPELGKEAFESIGAMQQHQMEEASRDARAILTLPEEQRIPALRERAANLKAEGRDPRDTLASIELDPKTRQNELRIIANAPLTAVQADTSRRAEEAAGATRLTDVVKENLKTSTGLRKEVNTLLKDFFAVTDSFARIQASAINPDAAGDLALVFNYMKMLDPGSTVREGEFRTAATTGSLAEAILNKFAKVATGEILEFTRDDFVARSKLLMEAATAEAQKTADSYERIAVAAGVDVNAVLATFQEKAGVAPFQEVAPITSGRFTVEEVP